MEQETQHNIFFFFTSSHDMNKKVTKRRLIENFSEIWARLRKKKLAYEKLAAKTQNAIAQKLHGKNFSLNCWIGEIFLLDYLSLS